MRATSVHLVRNHHGPQVGLDQSADGDPTIGVIERPEFNRIRAHPTLWICDSAGRAFTYKDVPATPEIVRGHDIAVLVQGHSGFPGRLRLPSAYARRFLVTCRPKIV